MVTVSHIHASGRFNQSSTDFAKGLSVYRAEASVVTVTEVDNNTRARLLNSNGWKGTFGDKGPRDDCGITWNPEVWEVLEAETFTVSKDRYKNERKHLADTTEAAFAVLKHKASGKVVVWGSLHTPHGMQAELRANKIHSDVARAFISITNGYRRRARILGKKHNADAYALSADWNLNIRDAWVRRWFGLYSRGFGLKLNWTGNFPKWGTHGKEIIDATLYKGMNMKSLPKILAKNVGDDHTAYVETFTF